MIPFFSIIVPSYNRSGLLNDAIKSVLKQSYINWELLIVDDGSTDNTFEVVNQFKDRRIKYIYQENKGKSYARNVGIKSSKGKYICFLDSDDYYLPNHLKDIKQKIDEIFDETIALYSCSLIKKGNSLVKNDFIFDEIISAKNILNYSLNINSVCVHSEILSNHFFPEEFDYWEDTHLWVRISVQFPFYFIDKITTVIVNHEDRGYFDFINSSIDKPFVNYLNCIKDLLFTGKYELPFDLLYKKEILYLHYLKLVKGLMNVKNSTGKKIVLTYFRRDFQFSKFTLKMIIDLFVLKLKMVTK